MCMRSHNLLRPPKWKSCIRPWSWYLQQEQINSFKVLTHWCRGHPRFASRIQHFVFLMNSGNIAFVSQPFWERNALNRPVMRWSHISMTTTPCWGSRLVAVRARVVLAERIGAQPLNQCAGPGQPGGMACRGWPTGCMLGDGARGSGSFDPQHAGAPFCEKICTWSDYESSESIPFTSDIYWYRLVDYHKNLVIIHLSKVSKMPCKLLITGKMGHDSLITIVCQQVLCSWFINKRSLFR